MEELVTYHLRIYHFTLVVFSLLAAAGAWIIIQDNKPKTSFIKYEGNVTAIRTQIDGFRNPDGGKMHFIALDNSRQYFVVCVTDETGFRPKFEMLDSLKTGDRVIVYYSNDYESQQSYVWQGVKFIDRNGKPIFISGNSQVAIGIFVMLISGSAMMALYVLRRKNIIS